MGILGESWCFCKGVSKCEKMKAAIFSGKGPALARITVNGVSSTGFLIHRNLLLTAHVNVPSVFAAESSEIRLQNSFTASLVPHRFFITSSVLDLTVVGLDIMDGEPNGQGQQPHYLKTCSKPNLDLGSVVYFLGYGEKEELTVSEGKVVIATDNLIKMSTDGIMWSPGSAGFDAQGNLAFLICDPMKLVTSPNTKSSSTSSSSTTTWKKNSPLQFGIPIPVICDWLNQHWEGSLDELTKPRLPIIRLMSTGQKSEHSYASLTLRQVFKSTEVHKKETASSSNTVSKLVEQAVYQCSGASNNVREETQNADPHGFHVQGIPTPEIYESPKLNAVPIQKKGSAKIQLLDMSFAPNVNQIAVQSLPAKQLLPGTDKNHVQELRLTSSFSEEQIKDGNTSRPEIDGDIASTGSVNGAQSEVQSSSPPVGILGEHDGYSTEEETMYSAETAESRNYTSPREVKFQQVRRSQSCVGYNRWGTVQRSPIARWAMQDRQRSLIHGRKVHSQVATSQRSNDYFSPKHQKNDYFSPTVSSIMKKRNSSVQQTKSRRSAVQSSPRWMF